MHVRTGDNVGRTAGRGARSRHWQCGMRGGGPQLVGKTLSLSSLAAWPERLLCRVPCVGIVHVLYCLYTREARYVLQPRAIFADHLPHDFDCVSTASLSRGLTRVK